jgi:hypothetical protein
MCEDSAIVYNWPVTLVWHVVYDIFWFIDVTPHGVFAFLTPSFETSLGMSVTISWASLILRL